MKEKIISPAGIFVFAVLALAACGSPQRIENITVMSWNVQALFDGNDNGNEYAEYRHSAGWNNEKYRNRLNTLGSALAESLPDVLVLIEVESPSILDDFSKLPGMKGYHASFFGRNNGLGIGVLSRFPLGAARLHSVNLYGIETPRPVAEVWIEAASPLVLLACHWKSKLGGDEETETARRASALAVNRVLDEIAAAAPEAAVIVLGDLNENHDEFERNGGAYICALMNKADAEGIDPSAPILLSSPGRKKQRLLLPKPGLGPDYRDYLVLSADPGSMAVDSNSPKNTLYSPWFNEGGQNGSYYYREEWETIDHMLFNDRCFDGSGWDFESFSVITAAPFTGADGIPFAYNPRTGNGLSDHLPLAARLVLAP
ncbi:MAG: endonuclease/exonuclease/phosphatase family protein [Treponema sp.]|jgi:endonuclease/exonuclease/phosphatase family metal-dependent hydrolase|nr:endonuclease/exonuclease/phosphatase family protein [Treponema sp.]